ncbi:MAG: chemotaxis-specific methylesterase, two-component system, chemotaxis family, response regulator CheB [candidate division NC10 bacterium CSP1-5]|nr:MAG: chemotaxis-specific methylesterase, two-component system, chemotaxis family, response regulator CheB [candidate division NC10 bacterium CSP1-5]
MKKIKILLANRPRMLREVVREIIEAQPDMEVVGEVPDPVELLVAVKDTVADAVILDLEDSEEPGLASHLLAGYPNLTIVGLAPNGKTAFVRPGRREIVDPTGANILSALRQASMSPCSSEEQVKKGESP